MEALRKLRNAFEGCFEEVGKTIRDHKSATSEEESSNVFGDAPND